MAIRVWHYNVSRKSDNLFMRKFFRKEAEAIDWLHSLDAKAYVMTSGPFRNEIGHAEELVALLQTYAGVPYQTPEDSTDFSNKDECFLSVDDTAELVKKAEELEVENRAIADKAKYFEEAAAGERQRVERLEAHSEASKAVIAAQKQEIKTLEAAVTKRSNTIITQACKMRDLYEELEALRSANADLHKAAQFDPSAITLLPPPLYTPGELFPGVGGPLSAGPVVQRYEFGGFAPSTIEKIGTGAKPMEPADGAVVRVIARVLLRIIDHRKLEEYVNSDDLTTLKGVLGD